MAKHATVYRMMNKHHVCPWGIKVKGLLQSKGYQIEDRLLATSEDTEAFKQKHSVETTPQVFIDGTRVGGYEDTRRHLGLKIRDPNAKTYAPVIAIFATAAVLAVAVAWANGGLGSSTVGLGASMAMVLLALQKIRDVDGFATRFMGYDLLARAWPRYASVYPFVEGIAGLMMIAMWQPIVAGAAALLIGAIGAISVIKAVYVDKRELTCACVGGSGNVPLGPVSLAENFMMVGMGIVTLVA